MLGVTILGIFFTPALYVLMQGRKGRTTGTQAPGREE
jgi:hypothetical protein